MHGPFRKRSALLTTLISIALHGDLMANETLPSINVSATAVDQNLTSTELTSEDLQSMVSSTSDTASLLRNVPGLNIQKSGGVSGLPMIRGLADDRLRIKVDGMDLISACGNHMNPALSYISPGSVDKIITYTALSPVSSGGDSIGGTILVDSAAPVFAKPGEGILTFGEVGAFYRSNGDASGGNVSASIANESFNITYQGTTSKSDNYYAGDDFKPAGYSDADFDANWLDADEVGSTFYKSTNQSLSMAVQHKNHVLEFKYGEQDIPYQAWVNQRMDMTGNDSQQYNLNYQGEYAWGLLEAKAYKEDTRHAMQFDDDKLYWYLSGQPCVPGPTCAAGMPMDTEGENMGGTVKADIPLSSRDTLKVGAELQNYTLDDWWDASGRGMWPDQFININNGQRDRTALFAEWDAQWDQQWFTQLGVRGEKVDMDADEVQGYNANYDADAAAFNAADRSITDNNIDLTALARYKINSMSTLEFGYTLKTRSPNLYERYTWSTGGMAMRMINWTGDANGYVGNLELEPEVAHTISATYDWKSTGGIQVAPYYTQVDDYIDAERLPGSVGVTNPQQEVYLQFVNESAEIYGVDISGYYPLAEKTAHGSFTATGLVNYVRGKNDDTGDNLINMMPLNARFAVMQNKGSWENTVELELVDNKDNVSETRNELETSGYGLLHLRSSYVWKNVRIDFGIENALDKFYTDPLGGVYMGQGVTMTGTNTMGRPYVERFSAPGMGRSLYAGINYKF